MRYPQLRLVSGTLHRTPTSTRMPFRFGIAVMTEAPHVILHGTFEVDGVPVTGVAAEGLLPKWFDKSPDKGPEQELSELLLVIRQAMAFARAITPASAFRFWRQLYDSQMTWAAARGLPPLLANFGVSMIERAMFDALARAKAVNLSTLFRENVAGIDLGEIHPELNRCEPATFLPEKPLPRVMARHTVGLSDPLVATDVAPGEALSDGLPHTLEECVKFYGLKHFKIKVRGDAEIDLPRLREIASVITRNCGSDFAFTLDGNEQYKEFKPFIEFWDRIRADSKLDDFFRQLIFIEQPLHRSVALDPAVARISEWKNGPPMIIDESDAELGDLARALDLGYAGTSHKNCKGIIKGVAHRCLLTHRNSQQTEERYQMSGEDLVNIGPVALLQDLAMQAALGNSSVERNGHHYFRGLGAFPSAINELMLKNHGDLYTSLPKTSGSGEIARLNVVGGQLFLASVNAAPFGLGADLPMEGFETESV